MRDTSALTMLNPTSTSCHSTGSPTTSAIDINEGDAYRRFLLGHTHRQQQINMNAAYSIYEDPNYMVDLRASFNPLAERAPSPQPHASSANVGSSTPALNRKRLRSDIYDNHNRSAYGSANFQWPGMAQPSVASSYFNNPASTASCVSPSASPPPFTNTRYRLARGLDTPGHDNAHSSIAIDGSTDVGFRSRWQSSPETASLWLQSSQQPLGALDREHNGRKRARMSFEELPLSESWGQYVFRIAGGVAKGAWNFCKDTAFRGFKAGGGPAWDMSTGDPQQLQADDSRTWQNCDGEGHTVQVTSGLSGSSADEHYHDALESSMLSETDRPSKRLQTSQGDGWIVVSPEPTQPLRGLPTPQSRQRRVFQSRGVPARRARPSLTRLTSVNHAGSPHSAVPQAVANGDGIYGTSHERRHSASFASSRSPQTSPMRPAQLHSRHASVSNDAQMWSTRKQREERQADASMRRLNAQLKAMIREGKEALATKVELDEDDFKDEGYAEGDGGTSSSHSHWNNAAGYFGNGHHRRGSSPSNNTSPSAVRTGLTGYGASGGASMASFSR